MSDVVHGTQSAYTNHKCRCDACKLANAEASRRGRERRAWLVALGDNRVTHGTDSTYCNYQCRCDACKEAHRAAMRRFHTRQRVVKKLGSPRPVTQPTVKRCSIGYCTRPSSGWCFGVYAIPHTPPFDAVQMTIEVCQEHADAMGDITGS